MTGLCITKDCNRLPCTLPLHFRGWKIPPLCCVHCDAFMEAMSKEVTLDEGEHGLAEFRYNHRRWHLEEGTG